MIKLGEPVPHNDWHALNLKLEELVNSINKDVTTQVANVTKTTQNIPTPTTVVNTSESTPTSAASPVSPTSTMYGYSPLATPLQYGRILLDWSSWFGTNDSNVIGYDIFCTTDLNCYAVDTNLFTEILSSTSFTLSNLSGGVTYYLRVSPRMKDGTRATESSVVSATTLTPTTVYADANDPSTPGEIKVVRGTVLDIHHCDAIDDGVAVWSVHSGAGVTIALDNVNVKEGTGSIKVTVPSSITAVIKCTKSATSWDLSSYKYLKVYLKCLYGMTYGNLYFGETVYNEQSHVITAAEGDWAQESWDISAIAAASKNAVTLFSVSCTSGVITSKTFWIDYVFADTGPSKIEAFDGDRIITVYPKVYCGTYTGNATDNTVITLPRKGTPSVIFVKHYNAVTYSFTIWWHKSMAAGKSERFDGGVATISDGIKAVADGSFTIGYTAITSPVNLNGEQYNYIVLWED